MTQTETNKMSLIVFSGTVDKLMAATVLTSGAAAVGMKVDIFVTFWGLMAFRKGASQDPAQQKISAEFSEFGPAMQQAMKAKNVKSWLEMLRDAQDIGEVNVYACGLTMDMFGLKMEDFEDVVKGVKGVTGFMAEAENSKVTLFI